MFYLFIAFLIAALWHLYTLCTLYVVDRIIVAIGIFVHCQVTIFRKETTVLGLRSKITNDGGKEDSAIV